MLVAGGGGRESRTAPLGGAKKRSDFADKDHARCHEGLTFATRPSLRKGAIACAFNTLFMVGVRVRLISGYDVTLNVSTAVAIMLQTVN